MRKAKDRVGDKIGRLLIDYKGRTQTLSQWAKELGVPMKNLHHRIQGLGWDVERAFTKPYRESRSNRNKIAQT